MPNETPPPEHELEEWCREFCPTLPTRIESVIAEWNLSTVELNHVRNLILTHVRNSVST
jgi:hypothetical protein